MSELEKLKVVNAELVEALEAVLEDTEKIMADLMTDAFNAGIRPASFKSARAVLDKARKEG